MFFFTMGRVVKEMEWSVGIEGKLRDDDIAKVVCCTNDECGCI